MYHHKKSSSNNIVLKNSQIPLAKNGIRKSSSLLSNSRLKQQQQQQNTNESSSSDENNSVNGHHSYNKSFIPRKSLNYLRPNQKTSNVSSSVSSFIELTSHSSGSTISLSPSQHDSVLDSEQPNKKYKKRINNLNEAVITNETEEKEEDINNETFKNQINNSTSLMTLKKIKIKKAKKAMTCNISSSSNSSSSSKSDSDLIDNNIVPFDDSLQDSFETDR
jgi:hypothetical protein